MFFLAIRSRFHLRGELAQVSAHFLLDRWHF